MEKIYKPSKVFDDLNEELNLGLDLKGGMSALLEI